MIKREVFTSELEIWAAEPKDEKILDNACKVAEDRINLLYNSFNPNSAINNCEGKEVLKTLEFDFNYNYPTFNNIIDKYQFYRTNGKPDSQPYDVTCCLKGLFLKHVIEDSYTTDLRISPRSFYINFGGDICGRLSEREWKTLHIENSKANIIVPPANKLFSCFTSGNFGKRKHHITLISDDSNEKFHSLTIFKSGISLNDLPYLDALTTYTYALGEIKQPRLYDRLLVVAVMRDKSIQILGGYRE